ncbi:snRNA-activating protein complex subunit 4 [Apodemus speciosus]|uniref:snRNA-activating protein complex subunit 4 n=1 Tax=Apodemus speciosus TaxID=105296 RepID=A0ABQ0EGX0_APOSI
MDIDAEREKITQEIQELERILYPGSSSIHLDVSESSLSSDSEADSLPEEDLETAGAPVLVKVAYQARLLGHLCNYLQNWPKRASFAPLWDFLQLMPIYGEEERSSEGSNDEEDPKDKVLPEDPETCLQLNMVYQEVIREKLAEVTQLLAQNQEQQEEILFDLAGTKCPKVKDGKSLPSHMYIGHFLKPYFKDKVTGVGPPANEETREKATQGIKTFEQLLVTKWKHWEKALLRKSVVSDRLQRLLQPKLLKLEYLQEKQSRVSSELERQALEKQIKEAEKEIRDINQLPEEVLLGSRLDSHDWAKISNVNFEGARSAEEIRKFWQSSEHPSINKQEWSTEEVERLKAIATAHGHLEWHLVAEELGTSRSAFQCLQKFQQYNKALKRKEWTEEEDHMLTQLVQEMRVGNHIPYRRIVYFMEGRDSMQLIYRWTKSLDPSLKRGFWAPEEDAKLLQAVAKYGAQDWFKIREEVPGRSDAQCRDRYIRRLHFSLKKGRWNAKEEQQLIQLIEKYGVGHWARIASELPHRSGSQCLSKWKILARKKQHLQRRRGQRPRHSSQWGSSSSSSSSSEDYGSSSSSSSRSSSSSSSEDSDVELQESLESSRPSAPQQYRVPNIDLWLPTRLLSSQSQRGGTGRSPEHPAVSCLTQDATHSHYKDGSATVSAPEKNQMQVPYETLSTIPTRVQSRHFSETHQASVKGPACKTQADSIRLRLECARLASTPAFTLFIQGLIDTAGCMEVVRERKSQSPVPLQPGTQNPQPHLLQASSNAKNSTGYILPGMPGEQTVKRANPKGRPRVGSCRAEATPFQVPVAAPRGFRPKPKTVSELLREKRLRESHAKKATQALTTLNSQLLVSSPVILQPPLLPAPHGSPVTSSVELSVPVAPVMVSSSPSGSWQVGGISATDMQPPNLQTISLNPSHKGTQIAAPAAFRSLALPPGRVPTGCPLSALGQTSTSSQKQSLPKVLPILPAAPSLTQISVQPPASGQPLATKSSLPVNWVLTTHKLLSVQVPAVVNLPESVMTPETAGLQTKQLPSPAKPLASTDTEPKGPRNQEIPPTPGPEKKPLDLSLLSQESEVATMTWLKGCQGACVPPLGSRMPYHPPSLCSLRALSNLLLQKQDLEQKASSLVASQAAGAQPDPKAGALQTSLELVQRRFQDNPAYLLLKTRFLAIFSLPAFLATLPPNSVPTTLSPAEAVGSESDTEDLGDLKLKDRARQLDCMACRVQASPAAPDPVQEPRDEMCGPISLASQGRPPSPGEVSAPSHLDAFDDLDDLDVLRTRHARHSRK